MAKLAFSLAVVCALSAAPGFAQGWPEGKGSDRFDAGQGALEIAFLGHGSLAFLYRGSYIYVDPVSEYANFSKYPKADLILVTHEHSDHLDAKAIATLSKNGTRIILSQAARQKLGKGDVLAHNQTIEAAGIRVMAVPAYNVTPGRTAFHPKDRKDNGYLITAGSGSDALHIYIAGDTEPIPEMAALGPVDIAFLPMNQPYTMTPEQAASAARTIHPKILYPYHFGSTDTTALQKLLAANPEIEVRIRNLQ